MRALIAVSAVVVMAANAASGQWGTVVITGAAAAGILLWRPSWGRGGQDG